MTKQREILEFVIGAYSPETIPMARLAAYMGQFAALLGEPDKVHFVTVATGSARLRAAIEHEAIPKVRKRVVDARTMDGDSEVARAYENLDRFLREDNADGELRTVDGTKQVAPLLYFPGVKRERDEEYGPFHQQSQVYGVPISVGGKKALANVNLEDGDRTYYCEATRDIALRIAPLLFHNRVRASGMGKYLRNAAGAWQMQSFRIADFEVLDARPLAETVERLRSVSRKTGLDRDIIAKLAELREA
jgi:hypothetical protein